MSKIQCEFYTSDAGVPWRPLHLLGSDPWRDRQCFLLYLPWNTIRCLRCYSGRNWCPALSQGLGQSTHSPCKELCSSLWMAPCSGLWVITELCSHATARWVQVRCPGLEVTDRWLQLTLFPVSCPEWPFCAFIGRRSGWLLGSAVSHLWLWHTHALRGGKGKCFPHQQVQACLILLLACVVTGWSQRCSWSMLT